MTTAHLKFGIPDLDLTCESGVTVNPSSFAGHELIVLFCPDDSEQAAQEMRLYRRHCADIVGRDAWILAFGDECETAAVDGTTRILTVPDLNRRAWTAFRDLTDCPEAFERGSGAVFLFTRGGNLHRYWHGPGHVHQVLAELQSPSSEHQSQAAT